MTKLIKFPVLRVFKVIFNKLYFRPIEQELLSRDVVLFYLTFDLR